MPIDEVKVLTRREYELFRDLVYRQSGINLGEQKMQLVRARLGKRMRSEGFGSYREYYEFVKNDRSGRELTLLIDTISTNTTRLFRENQHFDFLARTVEHWATGAHRRPAPIRIWSAGCSSGEEPYSIAMTMDDVQRRCPKLRFKILATDISSRMLERARTGVFPPDRLVNVPPEFKRRYFFRAKENGESRVQIRPELRRLVKFARFNLMDERFPFRNGLDVIFCRNVMIYFDRPTQEALVAKFARVLNAEGYLVIGHSESLHNISHSLTYVMPTVYKKL
jgi:chemotaxis protein methyltransferase CheR